VWWRASTLLVGGGCCLGVVVVSAALLCCCLADAMSRRLAVAACLAQLAAGLCVCVCTVVVGFRLKVVQPCSE